MAVPFLASIFYKVLSRVQCGLTTEELLLMGELMLPGGVLGNLDQWCLRLPPPPHPVWYTFLQKEPLGELGPESCQSGAQSLAPHSLQP